MKTGRKKSRVRARTMRALGKERGEEYWGVQVKAWQESGKSMTEFCKDNNLTRGTFQNWKEKIVGVREKKPKPVYKPKRRRKPKTKRKTSVVATLSGVKKVCRPGIKKPMAAKEALQRSAGAVFGAALGFLLHETAKITLEKIEDFKKK